MSVGSQNHIATNSSEYRMKSQDLGDIGIHNTTYEPKRNKTVKGIHRNNMAATMTQNNF